MSCLQLAFTFPTNSEKSDIMLSKNIPNTIFVINTYYKNKHKKLTNMNNIDGILELTEHFTGLKNARVKPKPKPMKKLVKTPK
jgi:hypothetical protein